MLSIRKTKIIESFIFHISAENKIFVCADQAVADASGQATFYGGHNFTVLIWPVFSSQGLSTPDV